MRSDGHLIYVGRKDFQVKIRGQRVEIAEVEGALFDHDGIKEVAITTWESRTGDKRLIAYFVPSKHPAPTATALRRLLQKKLPAYMIPSRFVVMDSLPLTPNGKVDRRKLPLPGQSRPELESRFAPPRTPIETALAASWAEVLGLDHLGIHDHFLELGGNSLLASQIVARVINRFQVKLPVQSLFQAPTVADMALVITESVAGKLEADELAQTLADIESLSDEEALRLTSREDHGNK
jgi:hypothetical protein